MTMRLASLTADAPRGAESREIAGLASDSREVKPGFLFAALPGAKTDGSQYVADAASRGAAAILGGPAAEAAARAAGLPFVASDNPRRALALMAARFFGAQPQVIAAVTGTNGKTSIASFTRQIFEAAGYAAASIGTLGVAGSGGSAPLRHTTPDPVELHTILSQLKQRGVEHVALEASSHGLDQHRLDGVNIRAAGFTNITRDHLDYHPSFEAYLHAKRRLFSDLLAPGAPAAINADGAHADAFAAAAQARKLRVLTVGEGGAFLKLAARRARADGQDLTLVHDGRTLELALPLAGLFQASNALVAAAMALGLGISESVVFGALTRLEGATGRLQRVAANAAGAPVFVDYAHTPDALETVLRALRPHTQGRLWAVFGCGGDRDAGKRALMGEAAARLADEVIVTDDNPRSEDPAAIRAAVLKGAPGAREIGDRAAAIAEAVRGARAGDVVVIAGKGHETGQISGAVTRPFSDIAEARKAAQETRA